MLKYICDNFECKKEIDTKNFFCEITVRELKPFLLKGRKGGDFLQQQITEKKLHLCQICYFKFLKEAHL